MKTKFLSVSLGISAVLLSASVFMYSINPTKAATLDKFPTPEKFTADEGNTLGKYAIQYQMLSWTDGGSRTNVQIAMVYDSQTGKSVVYESDNGGAWARMASQLPASPMQ